MKRKTPRQKIDKLNAKINKLKRLIGGCDGCSECNDTHFEIANLTNQIMELKSK